MSIKVAVVGYGTIGQRLADGVALQKDMELVGVVDVAPTLAVRALVERECLITSTAQCLKIFLNWKKSEYLYQAQWMTF